MGVIKDRPLKKSFPGVGWHLRLGFTLMEIMMAVAILSMVMAATAHGLIYSYNAITLQEERTTAINDCRSVIAALRRVAYTCPESEMCPGGDAPMFPCVLLNWLDTFPETLEDAEENAAIMEQYGGFFSLDGQSFEIACRDAEGDAAVMNLNPTMRSSNTNPAYVTVITRWRGMRGRIFTVEMNAILTER